MLPQNPQSLFLKDRLEDDLWEMCPRSKRRQKQELFQKIIEETKLSGLLSMHPYDLSGGEQQRAALAKVLLLEPDILLLDEPTKGLDGFYKEKLGAMLRHLCDRGMTVIMASHDVEFCAAYGDSCGLCFDGSIAAEQPAHTFFLGNSFYTTAANRMSRQVFPGAVTTEEVIRLCRKTTI